MKKKQINSKKTYTFEEVYLPLKLYWGKAFGGQGGMAFDFPYRDLHDNAVYLSPEDQERIVGILNGEITERTNTGLNLSYENSAIYCDDKLFIDIRGWGHLTGCGALNLPSDVAAKIQDDFGKFIVEKLTK